jgi:hypothetical protein
LLSDQFEQIGADENPLPPDLGSRDPTCPRLAEQTVFADAQEYRGLDEADSGGIFLRLHAFRGGRFTPSPAALATLILRQA